MKKNIFLLLLLTCSLFEKSNAMLGSYQEFIYQKFNKPINWQTIMCMGISIWMIIDKSLPLVKKYYHRVMKTPTPKTFQDYVNEQNDYFENKNKELKAWKKTLAKTIYNTKIAPLERRLAKFNDVMVDYKDASETLIKINNQCAQLREEITTIQLQRKNDFLSNDLTPPTTPNSRCLLRTESFEDVQDCDEHLSYSSGSDEEYDFERRSNKKNNDSHYAYN